MLGLRSNSFKRSDGARPPNKSWFTVVQGEFAGSFTCTDVAWRDTVTAGLEVVAAGKNSKTSKANLAPTMTQDAIGNITTTSLQLTAELSVTHSLSLLNKMT